MKQSRVFIALLMAFTLLTLFTGCAGVGVEVWERDVLAKPSMQLDANGNDRSLDDHIYFSKEGSSGGRGFGGGGCGCN